MVMSGMFKFVENIELEHINKEILPAIRDTMLIAACLIITHRSARVCDDRASDPSATCTRRARTTADKDRLVNY